jgi:transposase
LLARHAEGETEEKKLEHASGEAEKFYRSSPGAALIGMESTGNCQWFVQMATTLGHELWVGDAAKIRASEVRQQKNDRRDAALILKLLVEGRFPRIWTPSKKDQRQLLRHRYKGHPVCPYLSLPEVGQNVGRRWRRNCLH